MGGYQIHDARPEPGRRIKCLAVLLLHCASPGKARSPVHLTGMCLADDGGKKPCGIDSLVVCQLVDFQLEVLGKKFAYYYRAVVERFAASICSPKIRRQCRAPR